MSLQSSFPCSCEISTMASRWLKFNPADEDLLTSFLKPKTLGLDTQPIFIGEVIFCEYEPSDLRDLCIWKSNSVWHFFCPRESKYRNSELRNRQTRAGFWKPTAKCKAIYAKGSSNKAIIGWRRTLAFYQGNFKQNVKTKWFAYEYELNSTVKGLFVLCKVELRDEETSKRQPRTLQKTCKGRESEQVSSNSIIKNTTQMMNESPCVEIEVTDPAIFISENQVTSQLSANSACIDTIPGASDSKQLHLEQMVFCSASGYAEPTSQMDYDIGSQNQDDDNINVEWDWAEFPDSFFLDETQLQDGIGICREQCMTGEMVSTTGKRGRVPYLGREIFELQSGYESLPESRERVAPHIKKKYPSIERSQIAPHIKKKYPSIDRPGVIVGLLLLIILVFLLLLFPRNMSTFAESTV